MESAILTSMSVNDSTNEKLTPRKNNRSRNYYILPSFLRFMKYLIRD